MEGFHHRTRNISAFAPRIYTCRFLWTKLTDCRGGKMIRSIIEDWRRLTLTRRQGIASNDGPCAARDSTINDLTAVPEVA
jgi:hypothetical protein